jgi:acetylornithine deacetylase/succinyl-diaminopimelate desuccinylase-like protein
MVHAMGSANPSIQSALSYADDNYPGFLAQVAEFAAIPSVSGDPARHADVRRAAAWLAGCLRAAGLRGVRSVPTRGHPIVVGGWGQRRDRPTLLLYGHYDVQPPGPATAWSTEPFTPTVRNGLMYGRGVSDDKGQLLTHVAAIRSWLRGAGTLPVNIRCVFDGEEEIGSPHLGAFLRRHWAWLAPDAVVISDTRMRDARTPALTISLRGMVKLAVTLRGARSDLHSGSYGGAVTQPALELCRLLTGLHDAGRLPPRLRTGTRILRAAERARMARSGPSDAELFAVAGAHPPGIGTVERGFSAYELVTARPALVVSSLTVGGVVGALPATARAEFELRLAPGQRPELIKKLVLDQLHTAAPRGVTLSARVLGAAAPIELPTRGPLFSAAFAAARRGFGRDPVLLRSGGTIPVVAQFQARAVPVALLGFALPDDHMHAPDERLSLAAFRYGVRTSVHLLAEFARRFRDLAVSHRKKL